MTRYICLPNGGCLTFSAETLSFSRWHPLYLAGARSPVSCCELSSTITLFHAKGIDHILSIENIGNRPYSFDREYWESTIFFRSRILGIDHILSHFDRSLPPSLPPSHHPTMHPFIAPLRRAWYSPTCPHVESYHPHFTLWPILATAPHMLMLSPFAQQVQGQHELGRAHEHARHDPCAEGG